MEFCDFLAGWNAGVTALVVGHPADTIKVRQQIHPNPVILNIVKETFKNEGIRGFYKGMLFPVLGSGALNAVFFGVYGSSLRWMKLYKGETPIKGESQKITLMEAFLAGCAAGFVQTFITCPIEMIKVRRQADRGVVKLPDGTVSAVKDPGVMTTVRSLYQNYGWRIFYKGYLSLVYRDVFSFGVYMYVYELLAPTGTSKSPLSIVFAGGWAGTIAWFVIIPLDVVKSRLQSDNLTNPQYRGILHCTFDLYQKYGLRVFGRGTALIVGRAFPVNAAIFLGYEGTLNLCNSLRFT